MKKIIGLILTLVCLQASAQYDSTRVWQSVFGDGYTWKNGQFNGALVFPIDTPHLKTAQRAIGFKGGTPYYWNGTKWNSFAGAGGTGTLTDFVIGNMTPFFTTNAATTTTVPTITFTLSPSAAYTIWGNNGGSAAAPAYFTPVLASNLFSNQGTTTTVLHGNASGPPSWGQVSAADLNLTGTQSVRITGSAIALHNDQTTPDTFKVYGTDSTAARGWQPSQPSRLTSPQDGDNIVIQNDPTGRAFYVNVAGSQGTAFTGTPTVVDLGNLNYFVNTNGSYKINGIYYPSSAGIVTLPVGTADPGEGRIDLIVATPSGVGSVQGENSDNPQAPVPDITTTLEITSVLILEDQTVPAPVNTSTNLLVWDENVGPTAEATFSTTGTVTVNANANTAGQAFNGTKYITVTAMANNSRLNFTFGGAKNKTDYTYFVGRIKLNNAWAATTTYSARLFNGATLSNAVSLMTWGIVRTTTGSYMTFAIPMSQFTGSTQFTGITIQRTTVAGTTNWQLDYLQLQANGTNIINNTTGMTNPMTKKGSFIVGGTSGIPLEFLGNTTTTSNVIVSTGDGTNNTTTQLKPFAEIDTSTGAHNYIVRWLGTNQFDVVAAATGSGTVSSGSANRLAYYSGSGTTVTNLAAITANRALISDGSGLPTHSSVTATQLGYLSTTTSDVQTQLDAKLTASNTATVTNKRWTARVGSTTSSATPTINTDNVDIYKLTAQAADITSFTTNLSGTPVDGDMLEIEITGTAARAIAWGASFVSSTVTLPTTTVTTATLTVVFQYFTTSSYGNNKWVCVNSF